MLICGTKLSRYFLNFRTLTISLQISLNVCVTKMIRYWTIIQKPLYFKIFFPGVYHKYTNSEFFTFIFRGNHKHPSTSMLHNSVFKFLKFSMIQKFLEMLPKDSSKRTSLLCLHICVMPY